MNQKERLVELLDNAFVDFIDFANRNPAEKTSTEFIADYLLDNGVIVPPVKVGQTVYVVDYTRLGNMIFECKIDEISQYSYGTYYYLNWGLHIPRFKACKIDSFGKTVYTSREDAEKALRGDEGK